jgi:hypothetical protein
MKLWQYSPFNSDFKGGKTRKSDKQNLHVIFLISGFRFRFDGV